MFDPGRALFGEEVEHIWRICIAIRRDKWCYLQELLQYP
jgi:hypothetical protein